MARIPEFLLRALYVKGSMESIADGFRFQLKNELGPARMVGARPLQLDRRPIPLESCSVEHGDQITTFANVSDENSVLMRKGEVITVRVQGTALRPGRRTLSVNVIVKDMGDVSFTVTDQVR